MQSINNLFRVLSKTKHKHSPGETGVRKHPSQKKDEKRHPKVQFNISSRGYPESQTSRKKVTG